MHSLELHLALRLRGIECFLHGKKARVQGVCFVTSKVLKEHENAQYDGGSTDHRRKKKRVARLVPCLASGLQAPRGRE